MTSLGSVECSPAQKADFRQKTTRASISIPSVRILIPAVGGSLAVNFDPDVSSITHGLPNVSTAILLHRTLIRRLPLDRPDRFLIVAHELQRTQRWQ